MDKINLYYIWTILLYMRYNDILNSVRRNQTRKKTDSCEYIELDIDTKVTADRTFRNSFLI